MRYKLNVVILRHFRWCFQSSDWT